LALAKEFSEAKQDRMEKLLGDLYLEERIVSLKKTVASESALPFHTFSSMSVADDGFALT
jgi:hypothetical protein